VLDRHRLTKVLDRQTDIQTHKSDRKTGRLKECQTQRQTNRFRSLLGRQIHKRARQTDTIKGAQRQTYSKECQTDRQINKSSQQTDKQEC
jgi:hypothetical protein